MDFPCAPSSDRSLREWEVSSVRIQTPRPIAPPVDTVSIARSITFPLTELVFHPLVSGSNSATARSFPTRSAPGRVHGVQPVVRPVTSDAVTVADAPDDEHCAVELEGLPVASQLVSQMDRFDSPLDAAALTGLHQQRDPMAGRTSYWGLTRPPRYMALIRVAPPTRVFTLGFGGMGTDAFQLTGSRW